MKEAANWGRPTSWATSIVRRSKENAIILKAGHLSESLIVFIGLAFRVDSPNLEYQGGDLVPDPGIERGRQLRRGANGSQSEAGALRCGGKSFYWFQRHWRL